MFSTQHQIWDIFFDKPNKSRYFFRFYCISRIFRIQKPIILFTEIYLNTSDHPMLWEHSSFWLNRFYSLWCIRIQNHECLAKGFLCKFSVEIAAFGVWCNIFVNLQFWETNFKTNTLMLCNWNRFWQQWKITFDYIVFRCVSISSSYPGQSVCLFVS